MQVDAEPEPSPNLSLLDEPHLLAGIEGASPLKDDDTTSNIRDDASHVSLDIAQFSIKRKPVEYITAAGSKVLVKGTQVMVADQKVHSGVESPRRAHVVKNWWMEISACVLSQVALIAIIVTLQPLKGQPLPQWPYQISVNTLISIYVLVLKATILFVTAEGLGQLKWRWLQRDRPLDDLVKYDQATRGPLGALNLLWKLRLRHFLSSAGAAVALVVLTVDPFTQQIIHYYDCSVPIVGLQASVPRTNVHFQRNMTEDNSTNDDVDPSLRAPLTVV